MIGLVALVRPEGVPALFGGSAPTAASRTEVRAVYGGIPLAFAAALAHDPEPGVVRTVALASAGMAAGRLAGAAVEGRLPAWPTGAFLALEAGLAVATGIRPRAGR